MNGGNEPGTPQGPGDPAGSWPAPGTPGGGPAGSWPSPEPGYQPPGQPGYGTPAPGQPGYGMPPPGQGGYGPQQPYGGQQYGQPGYGTQPPAYGAPVGDRPPDHLVWGIIASVCGVLFCWFGLGTGIAAVIYANQVKTKWAVGDQQGALKASSTAKGWAVAATVLDVLGLIGGVIYIIVLVTALHNGATTTP